MKIIKTKNYNEMSENAVNILINEISKKPDLVLGLPTGKTPRKFYKKLSKLCKKNKVDFSKIKTFNLDEYYPISKSDKKSFVYYMFKNFFNKININKSNISLLNGDFKDYKKECENYELKIKKSPIDLQFLGIGINGHIAFNEPGSDKNSKTRLTNLTKETIKKNSNLFNRKRFPKKGLTMGIKTIFSAKKIVLLASGKHKSKAIASMINGKISKGCPASFLRNHKNTIIILDKKAASLLDR